MANGSAVVGGVRLWFEDVGQGPPVVLISGTGMSGRTWELLGAPALREAGYRVVTFDSRGVGHSEGPPAPYSVEEMAADTAGLIEQLQLGPTTVIGLSLGGSIAQHLAATRPELVQALVLWAATGESPSFFRRLLSVEREIGASMPVPESWHLWQYLLISLPFGVLQTDDAMVDQVADLLGTSIEWSGDGRNGQFAADVAWDDADHSELYPRIACPCLVIAHEHDIIYPPHAARVAVDSMPRARFVELRGLAHGQALEAAPAVTREVLTFLRGVMPD
jgi:thioesterase CepJ